MASIVKSEDLICFHIDFYSPKPLKIIMQLRLLSMRGNEHLKLALPHFWYKPSV